MALIKINTRRATAPTNPSEGQVWFNTSSNKKKMLTVPFGEDPMYIVSSYLQSDDGLEALKMLEKLLEE